MADQSETHPDNGIEIEIHWFDDDVIELLVRASNGRFAGMAELYVSHDELPRLADALRGFPASPCDHRELQLGTFDANHAGGGVRLRFWCKDRAGHALVEVSLRTDGRYHFGRPEMAELVIPVEPYAIDRFVQHLGHLEVTCGASARLQGAV
jgi:hypothetical protein